ncbi:MAG: hypothetical protein D8M58_16465 [Calditrichaeota bacterium]|nr:MAG: hypothetical protein DWQ03_08195 [Calditrichota bacterium]MBL1207000.1 hypothetical protein [Calditrichota bacterium]NOG46827.1 hypothetical protein [Calditrichota bacterium]
MKNILTVFLIIISFYFTCFAQNGSESLMQNYSCNYMGEKPPQQDPIKFGAGSISTSEDEFNFEISPSGKEMLFARHGNIMLVKQSKNGEWSKPYIAPFSSSFVEGEPCFSPDGQKIYFSSMRPLKGSSLPSNMWVSERQDGNWGKPKPFTEIASKKAIHAITFASNGNAYDSGLIQYKFQNDLYTKSKRLNPHTKGSHPFVYPNDSLMIFAARPPKSYKKDLYVIFKKQDGSWTVPQNIGNKINTKKNETSPFITPDGKYLFFGRDHDFYWVKADFINDIRSKLFK